MSNAFPALGNRPDPVIDDGPRSPSISAARMESDVDELVDAAERLVNGTWDYDAAMADHVARLNTMYSGRTELMFSVENLHLRYLPPSR
jgi:hypothetical protein